MYQLVVVMYSVNVFGNGEFFQFRACRHGNAFGVVNENDRLVRELWIEPYTRTFTSMVQHLTFGPMKIHTPAKKYGFNDGLP